MGKLTRYLSWKDWLFVAFILGFTVLQVYCTMLLMDYISGITSAIQYLNYHNDPESFFNTLGLAALYEPYRNVSPFPWNEIVALAKSMGLSGTALSSLESVANASTGDIWYQGGMMVATATGMVGCQVVISLLASYVSADTSTKVRQALNNKVTDFSLAEINQYSTASLITRTTNDVQMYQMTVLVIFRMFFAAPVTVIWAICKVQSVSWTLMWPMVVGVVVLVAVLVLTMVLAMPKFTRAQKLLDRVNGITRENIVGIRVVHAYNAEDYQEKKFKKTNDALTKDQLFTSEAMALLSPVITLIMNGVSLAVYWIGAYLIKDKTTDYAQILSTMMLSTQIIMSFMMLLMMFFLLPRAQVSAKRINAVLDSSSSITDPKEEAPQSETGSVEFRHVSFAYPQGDGNVIQDISFSAKQGETIAFIGETGSGKTTILNLIERLFDCTEGEVLVNGVNVKDLKQKTLHSLIGYVPQKGLLFSGTIKSNIAFGDPSLSEEEIENAAKIAEADSFIQEMPEKYDAPIAQGGTNVSGGQRQRLCIARAVAMKPQILLFDDSFSALDFKTDHAVRENLKSAEKNATKLIVAQRIGTIMDADKIVVLSEGKMVGYGTHHELLENCPTYRDIALSQLSKEELGL